MQFKNITKNSVINAVGKLVEPNQKIQMPVEYYFSNKSFVDKYVNEKKAEIFDIEEYNKYLKSLNISVDLAKEEKPTIEKEQDKENPVEEKPVVEKQDAKKPVVEKPVVEKPVEKKPVEEKKTRGRPSSKTSVKKQ